MAGDRQAALDCGRLLGFALTPKLRPSQNPDYRTLVERLQRDAGFDDLFRGVVEGLGLLVLGADEYGVQLGCEAEGPFSLRPGEWRPSAKRPDRLVFGLIQLAVAAWCFPRASELDQQGEALKLLQVQPFVRWLVQLCEQLEEQADQDVEADRVELQGAWREILRRAETRAGESGRRAPSTLTGMIEASLELLEGHGLMRKESEEEGGTWRTTRAYRAQVRELAATAAFRQVRGVAPEPH